MEKVIIVTPNELRNSSKNKPLAEIKPYDFYLSENWIWAAEVIIYIAQQNVKILKNRDDFIGIYQRVDE